MIKLVSMALAGLAGFWLFSGGVTGLIGAGLGAVVGYLFGQAVLTLQHQPVVNPAAARRELLFETLFPLLGYIAQADGRVSREERHSLEALLRQQSIPESEWSRVEALFARGCASDFSPEASVAALLRAGLPPELLQLNLEFLVQMAISDGHLDEAERQALLRIAQFFSVTAEQLQTWIDAALGQYHSQSARAEQPATMSISEAYALLGATEEQPLAEVKRCYRRQLSLHHPDKLHAQGAPQELIANATARTQALNEAWRLIESRSSH